MNFCFCSTALQNELLKILAGRQHFLQVFLTSHSFWSFILCGQDVLGDSDVSLYTMRPNLLWTCIRFCFFVFPCMFRNVFEIFAHYFMKFRLRLDMTPKSFLTQCRTSLIWNLFFQVSNGPILDILFGFGQHLHPGFNESRSFSGRGLRCGINDMANWRKLQNCHCSHLDNLRDFLHTTHIFTWRKRKYITGYILLWIFA